MKAFAVLISLPALAQTPPALVGSDLPKVSGPLPGQALVDHSRQMGDSNLDLSLRWQARHMGTLPCVAVPAGTVTINHSVMLPAGWMAYAVTAGPQETVKARVRSEHNAWFRVLVVNRWGQLGKGMLQNRIPTGNPAATFINSDAQSETVYFVVDSTILLSSDEPYSVTFSREPLAPAKP